MHLVTISTVDALSKEKFNHESTTLDIANNNLQKNIHNTIKKFQMVPVNIIRL
jgi:hypothetical protein